MELWIIVSKFIYIATTRSVTRCREQFNNMQLGTFCEQQIQLENYLFHGSKAGTVRESIFVTQ